LASASSALVTAGVTIAAGRTARGRAARNLDFATRVFAKLRLAVERAFFAFALGIAILLNKDHIRYNHSKIAHKINCVQESARKSKIFPNFFADFLRVHRCL
jgi:hypothetical protein